MPPIRKRAAVTHSSNEPTEERKLRRQAAQSSTDASNKYSHVRCWLMKSEGESRVENGHDFKFSIDDLAKCDDQTTQWEGVRNYQARNFMRDCMKLGQKAFFYHSNVKEPGIMGLVEVVRESYPDHTQFEKGNYYFDKTASTNNPRWFMVDVKLVRRLRRCVTLKELKYWHLNHKQNGGPLWSLSLFTSARLSVLPIRDEEWDFICSLEDQQPVIV